MKGSSVLKKLLLLCSLTAVGHLTAGSDLQNYLTQEKNLIFDYQEMKNQLEMDKLHDSWISPITVSYQENWTTQPLSGTQSSSAFSVGIDQPIFRSGGIYYAIKYSDALRGANSRDIAMKKRALIGQAIDILFSIRKLKLQHQKLRLLVHNDNIDIQRKQESYNAGILDSSFLDQAILKRNQNESQLLDIELNLAKLRSSFKLLSRKNPDKLRVPHLRMISLKHYKRNHMDVAKKELRTLEKKYSSKITWAKYLPSISVHARYTNTNRHAPGMDDDYSTYGFKISVPLNINSATDIESSRVSYMQSMTELQDSRRAVGLEYNIVRKSIAILNKKSALAKKDERLYRRLYSRTKDLVKAGEKTKQDVQTMRNSLAIKKLDRRIFALEKQQQLLKLYTKVSR